MSELLDRSGIQVIAGPVVIGLPAGKVAKMDVMSPEWVYEAKLVWIVPGPDVVKVIVRRSPEGWSLPFVQPIPKEGALAFRELPAWAPSVVYKELATALPCPRCGSSARRYRQLRNALVCLKCACSFDYPG